MHSHGMKILQVGSENSGNDFAAYTHVSRIFHYAHDLNIGVHVAVAVSETVAKSACRLAEEASRETFVDDCHRLGSRTVLIVQFAADNHRHAHGGKISRAYPRVLDVHVLAFLWNISRDGDVIARAVICKFWVGGGGN